jgi:hypothetical protein
LEEELVEVDVENVAAADRIRLMRERTSALRREALAAGHLAEDVEHRIPTTASSPIGGSPGNEHAKCDGDAATADSLGQDGDRGHEGALLTEAEMNMFDGDLLAMLDSNVTR